MMERGAGGRVQGLALVMSSAGSVAAGVGHAQAGDADITMPSGDNAPASSCALGSHGKAREHSLCFLLLRLHAIQTSSRQRKKRRRDFELHMKHRRRQFDLHMHTVQQESSLSLHTASYRVQEDCTLPMMMLTSLVLNITRSRV